MSIRHGEVLEQNSGLGGVDHSRAQGPMIWRSQNSNIGLSTGSLNKTGIVSADYNSNGTGTGNEEIYGTGRETFL